MMLVTEEKPEHLTMQEIYYHLQEDDWINITSKNWDCQQAIQIGFGSGNKDQWKASGFCSFRPPSVKKLCRTLADEIRPIWKNPLSGGQDRKAERKNMDVYIIGEKG